MSNTENTETRKHSSLGMSRWPALFACACFESKPVDETSTDAIKGTEVHNKLAEFLQMYKEDGKRLDDVDSSSLDMFEASALACAKWVATQTSREMLMIEKKVSINNDIYGFVDVAWYDAFNDCLVILDFKTFRNVSRDYTAQLAGYGYALAREYNPLTIKLYTWYGDFANQPEPIVTDTAGCREYYKKILEIVESKDKKPSCCSWCEFCKHNGTCPAFKAVAVQTTTPALQEVAERKKWELLEASEKVKLLLIAETAMKWASAIRDLAKTDIENNIPIIDEATGVKFELRFTRGRLTPNTAEACRLLQDKGVDINEIKKSLTISVTSIKALLKGTGLKTKEIDELLESVSERGNGSYSMVKA